LWKFDIKITSLRAVRMQRNLYLRGVYTSVSRSYIDLPFHLWKFSMQKHNGSRDVICSRLKSAECNPTFSFINLFFLYMYSCFAQQNIYRECTKYIERVFSNIFKGILQYHVISRTLKKHSVVKIMRHLTRSMGVRYWLSH